MSGFLFCVEKVMTLKVLEKAKLFLIEFIPWWIVAYIALYVRTSNGIIIGMLALIYVKLINNK
ncbi:putative membrane protein [Paenibacillus sp. DS2015]